MLKDCKSRIIDRPLSDFRRVSETDFLDLGFCHTIPALEVVTNHYAALNMRQLIGLYTVDEFLIERQPPPDIGYLFYNFKYGFRRNMLAEDKEEQTQPIAEGVIPFSEEYFRSLEPMTQEEIQILLETHLVNYPGRVVNGSHRAFAMAGHLFRGGQYTPFYSMDLT